jgi:hypothetical protein
VTVENAGRSLALRPTFNLRILHGEHPAFTKLALSTISPQSKRFLLVSNATGGDALRCEVTSATSLDLKDRKAVKDCYVAGKAFDLG